LRKIFEDPNIGKIGHNLKFDLKFLIAHFGWNIKGNFDDSMLMHHLLDENTLHGLKLLAARFTDLGNYAKDLETAFSEVKHSRIPLEDKHYGKVPSHILKLYALTDADATFRLYERFKQELENEGLYKFYRRVDMEVMRVLIEMELTGVCIDLDRVQELKVEFETKLEQLQKDINSYSSTGLINIKSAIQLRHLLYDQLKLPVLKMTEKGEPSTDEEVLQQLKDKTNHPILDLLLEFRKASKLYTTYITSLAKNLGPDGRLHTTYLQQGTVTGRLASSGPNLQNIPKGSTIRNLFVPTEGWYMIVADYAQAELRAWAAHSGDERFRQVLTSSDVHSSIGTILLNKPADQITEEERTKVKGAVFGMIYGRGAGSLAREFGMTVQEAQGFIEKFFQMFPISAQWLLNQEEFAKRNGYVRSLFGRKRRLPEVNSSDEVIRAQALRMSRNAPVQSVASDLTNIALTKMSKKFKEQGLTARILMQIHDSIIVEAEIGEVRVACEILKECMLTPPALFKVPLAVKIEVSDCWGGKPIDIVSFG
jgi:DNA polymerase-1